MSREEAQACRSGISLAAPEHAGIGSFPGPMSRARPTKPPSRYSMDACIFEIAAMRDREGLQDKDIFLSIKMSQTAFSRKMAGARKFNVEELGRIADFFAAHTGRALPGWPLVNDQACRIIEASLSSGKTVGAAARQ